MYLTFLSILSLPITSKNDLISLANDGNKGCIWSNNEQFFHSRHFIKQVKLEQINQIFTVLALEMNYEVCPGKVHPLLI